MKSVLLALLFLTAAPASAQNFWIPAEKFTEHTNRAMEGSPTVDEVTGKQVHLLRDGQQVRITVGLDNDLSQYLEGRPSFEVCISMANYDSGVTNTVRSVHPNPENSQGHTLSSDSYAILCSKPGPIDASNLRAGGVKVISPSQGLVKVRGVSVRLTEGNQPAANLLAEYEYSRALGYLWGDGGITTDGKSLFYPKTSSNTSNHFGSVAEGFFGSSLSENSQGSRYKVELDGITPARFLTKGISLSDISDKRAFLTSVIETEGAVLVARITDDKSRDRCDYIKTLVNDLNPQCAANTCTDGSCSTPNCAFVAHGKFRNQPDVPGVNSHCGVYLSGVDRDWKALFGTRNYHFVKTDRTPGGEPIQRDPTSRPNYTR